MQIFLNEALSKEELLLRPLIGVSSVWSGETWDSENIEEDFFYIGRSYINSIYKFNAIPLVLTPIVADIPKKELVKSIIEKIDGLLLSGGGNVGSNSNKCFKPHLIEQQRRRYEFEALLIKEAWESDLPVLGICRGHQMLVEVLGGTITEQPISGHTPRGRDNCWHNIRIKSSSKLANICGTETWKVNSFHVQAVERIPNCLEVTARCDDGTIEAVEARDKRFFMGVQFHPEMMVENDEIAFKFMREFINVASNNH